MIITYTYRSNSTIPPKEITPFGESCFTNINGRLYDPVLCRMLSPDNFACPDRTIVSVGMQDASGTQGYNRYTYVLNNPLKYKDPSGEFFGVDDAIVAGAGFILGAGAYVLTHDVSKFTWSDVGKAALTGLAVAAIAEAGYLTLGGGLVAASSAAGAVGGAGTISGATSFATAFGISFGSNVISNREQIKDAYNQGKGWSGFALTVAYAGVASISAGLANNSGLQEAEWLGKGINEAQIFSNAAEKGLSTLVQKSYDVESHRWDLSRDFNSIAINFVAGFVSSYNGQLAGKFFSEQSGLSRHRFKYYLGKSLVENYTEAITYDSWNFILTGDKSVFRDLYTTRPIQSVIDGILGYWNKRPSKIPSIIKKYL